jgi:IclR family KDG regulon transcriptional repressor
MSSVESSHIVRTLRTLEALALRPHGTTELAEQLDAHPRTIRRLLAKLAQEGYAEPTGTRGEYAATLKLVALAGHIIERTDIVRMAFPFVARLRNATGEASHFSVPGEHGVLHLVQETGESVVMVKPRLGEQVPYHATASGKALLAYLPERLERVLSGGALERYTDHTLVDPADLLLELSRVRELGYAIDDLEQSLDLRCVAAPVFDHTGSVVACVGVSVPALRLAAEQMPGLASHVVETAAALSRTFGFDPQRQPSTLSLMR